MQEDYIGNKSIEKLYISRIWYIYVEIIYFFRITQIIL